MSKNKRAVRVDLTPDQYKELAKMANTRAITPTAMARMIVVSNIALHFEVEESKPFLKLR